jgi:acetoin:2,6-dichlorophenolindophenol oxidoreductase subunit beta
MNEIKKMKYCDAIAFAMSDAMEDHRTLLIGQGVTDFKGIWGTTTGLHLKYPNRVVEAPLSEDSVAGICMGASLNGMYPINTHIRVDFGLLIFNQLINLAAKYRYMFGGLFEVPMMFRMVIGRSWGQGAQHSQSFQSLLGHIPGLMVLMPSNPQAIISSYKYARENYKGPIVMFEHRLMYELEFEHKSNEIPGNPLGSRIERIGSDITIIATSIMVLEASRAADYLTKFGISVEIIDLHSISHPDHELIFNSVKKTGRLLVADTSWLPYGVAAEMSRIIAERDPSILKCPIKSLGMQFAPCPTAKTLEDFYYPDVGDIIAAVTKQVNENIEDIPLPRKQSMTDFYKHFKGPF